MRSLVVVYYDTPIDHKHNLPGWQLHGTLIVSASQLSIMSQSVEMV